MAKIFATIFILLMGAFAASAQGPLSPPARPPVPLTSEQQEKIRAEETAKKTGANQTPVTANPANATTVNPVSLIKIPSLGGRISSGNVAIDAMVTEAATIHGLDPYLILSVMRHESGFNRNAISPKGASGLMQLMPATAARFGVRNIFDVRENILGGAKYLRWLLERFNGDVRLALAGYNAGEGAVEFYGNRIPPFFETQNYVRAIYSRYVGLRSTSTPQPVAAVETPKMVETSREKIPTYNQIIIFNSSRPEVSSKGKNE
jgi:soluble lytic murein transglycosylase-like protein